MKERIQAELLAAQQQYDRIIDLYQASVNKSPLEPYYLQALCHTNISLLLKLMNTSHAKAVKNHPKFYQELLNIALLNGNVKVAKEALEFINSSKQKGKLNTAVFGKFFQTELNGQISQETGDKLKLLIDYLDTDSKDLLINFNLKRLVTQIR